tara:strand:+ start:54 stop:332 length:279 start_codon:yes stop_codon:yes gene_type:complete
MNWRKPIAEGVFKGVRWRSMTTVGEMTSTVLKHELRAHNGNRALFGLNPIGAAEYVRQQHQKTVYQYLKSIKRMELYKLRAKYNNQKKVVAI